MIFYKYKMSVFPQNHKYNNLEDASIHFEIKEGTTDVSRKGFSSIIIDRSNLLNTTSDAINGEFKASGTIYKMKVAQNNTLLIGEIVMLEDHNTVDKYEYSNTRPRNIFGVTVTESDNNSVYVMTSGYTYIKLLNNDNIVKGNLLVADDNNNNQCRVSSIDDLNSTTTKKLSQVGTVLSDTVVDSDYVWAELHCGYGWKNE